MPKAHPDRRRRASTRAATLRLLPLLLVAVTGSAAAATATAPPVLVGRQPDGSYMTPTNQRLTPAGTQVEFSAARPTAIASRPDGARVALLNGDGLAGPDITELDLATLQTTAYDVGASGGSFDGIAYSADGSTIYASDTSGSVHVVKPGNGGQAVTDSSITMPGDNPVPGGLALTGDGRTMVVTLNRNNTLAFVDLTAGAVTTQVPVGVAPHSVLVLGDHAFVSNEGGRPPRAGDFTNMSSGSKVVADREHGAASTGTVSVVSLSRHAEVASIEVGLHPTALTFAFGEVFVADTNSDTVSVIDPATLHVIQTFSIAPFPGAPYGSAPTGIAAMPDGRLAVTLGRNNAVALYGWRGPRDPAVFGGLLPTGWYPSAVVDDAAHHRLVVANDKGVGSVMTSDNDPTGRTPKVVQEYQASVSVIPDPSAGDLAQGTAQVFKNNGWTNLTTAGCSGPRPAPVAIPAQTGDPSLIHHVFFVIKENRTYDQILGDDVRGNGDPAEVEYGRPVTPNQHSLASTFPLFDNFYDSGSLSADGHQWVVQADAPDYLEKDFSFPRSYPAMGFDALTYLPSGFLWEDATRHGRSVTNFAEYALEGGQLPEYSDIPSNDHNVVRDYPGFALNIPDQHRADIFLHHFADYVAKGNLADLTFIRLPDDHTGGTDPQYPTPAAEVADNDLALGRIVDAVSHSPYWKDSAFFVEEDDSQAGADHVDGHRSTLYVASPYARRGVVDSTYYTQINVVRTIEQILGLPPMNQMDLAATPIRSAFTDAPDATPFDTIANPIAVGSNNPSLAQLSGLAREWAQASAAQDLRHTDAADERIINRADWYSVKGFTVPYPGDPRVLHPWEVATLPKLPVVAGPESTLQPRAGAAADGDDAGTASMSSAADEHAGSSAAPADAHCTATASTHGDDATVTRGAALAAVTALPDTGRGNPTEAVSALIVVLCLVGAGCAGRRRRGSARGTRLLPSRSTAGPRPRQGGFTP